MPRERPPQRRDPLMFKTRRHIAAGLAAIGVLGIGASSAQAITTPQVVAGVPGSVLALGVATPFVALTGFQPGSTATGSGAIAVTSTNPSWDLTVADTANGGHLAKDGAARSLTNTALPLTSAPVLTSGGVPVVCPATADAQTANPLAVSTVTGGTTQGVAGPISAVDRLVASGSLVSTVNVGFSLPVNSNENLANTCLYDTTLTYTVQ